MSASRVVRERVNGSAVIRELERLELGKEANALRLVVVRLRDGSSSLCSGLMSDMVHGGETVQVL